MIIFSLLHSHFYISRLEKRVTVRGIGAREP